MMDPLLTKGYLVLISSKVASFSSNRSLRVISDADKTFQTRSCEQISAVKNPRVSGTVSGILEFSSPDILCM